MTTQIPKNQLYSRWDLLPDLLREATTSETNSAIVWKTGEAEHLPKEKLSVISRLVGYVLMGFVHPEDLAREIHENLDIDNRIATSIADPINKKIFQPLREELEKIYSPATEGGEQASSLQPVLMDSVLPPKTEDAAKVVATPSAPKFFQTGNIPKPATSPATIMSKPPMPPAGAVPSAPSTLHDTSGQAGSMNSPQAGQAAPFMLHMESKAQTIAPSESDFKVVGLSEEQFGKMEQKWTAPPRPAQIETSFALQQKPVSQNRSDTETRTVHYSEMKTPLNIQPMNIKAAPLPPMPTVQSKPMAPPKPPTPPLPPKPTAVQIPPQKPIEAVKQEAMLPGKPEEKELPEPNKI